MAFLHFFFKRQGSGSTMYIYTIWPTYRPSKYIIVILSLHSQVVSQQGRALEIWVFTLHTQERKRFLICRWLPSLKLKARTWRYVGSHKERLVFETTIFRCDFVSFREDNYHHTLKDKVQAMVPFPDFVGWDDTREFPRSHSTTEPPPEMVPGVSRPSKPMHWLEPLLEKLPLKSFLNVAIRERPWALLIHRFGWIEEMRTLGLILFYVGNIEAKAIH